MSTGDLWWDELLKECDEQETEPTALEQAIAMRREQNRMDAFPVAKAEVAS